MSELVDSPEQGQSEVTYANAQHERPKDPLVERIEKLERIVRRVVGTDLWDEK